MTSKLIAAAFFTFALTSGCYTPSSIESPEDRTPHGSADRAELEREGRSLWATLESDTSPRHARR